MKLMSSSFPNYGNIPLDFTCDGEDISPPLSWTNVPDEVESFALVVFNPDAPGGTSHHWLVYNISKDVRSISRASLPRGAKQVENDFGRKAYSGPCPRSGIHKYVFTLFALKTAHLNVSNKDDFFDEVEKQLAGYAVLIGLYGRS